MKKLFFLFLIIFITGCSINGNTIKDVDVNEFSKLIKDDNVFILDVHTPEQEHIPGTDAVIPFNQLKENLNQLPSDKNTPIALYCRSGSMSSEAKSTLEELGYTNIYNLLGGKKAWDDRDKEITIYKSPTCGCCVGYGSYMENLNYNVNTEEIQDMNIIKNKYQIPSNMQSCHTSIIQGYFVEGHVPEEAIVKLLTEKPDIDGIALPRMPAGSPGMPGIKQGPFIIYSLKDGQINKFMEI